jgi:hypothetical protein
MTVKKRSIVVGIFHDLESAKTAVEELRRCGLRADQLGILTRDNADQSFKMADMGTKAEEGALGGAILGASIGTIAGLAVAGGLMPAIGPTLAGGVLAGILSSAGLGVAAGGIIGALIGLGVPEDEARNYESEFKAGRTIVTVKANDRYSEAWQCLRRNGAYDMKTPRQQVVSQARASHAGDGQANTDDRTKQTSNPYIVDPLSIGKDRATLPMD